MYLQLVSMATTLGIVGECGVTCSHLCSDHLDDFYLPVQQLNMNIIQLDGRSRVGINNAQSSSLQGPPPPQSIAGAVGCGSREEKADRAAGCEDAHGDADVDVAAASVAVVALVEGGGGSCWSEGPGT